MKKHFLFVFAALVTAAGGGLAASLTSPQADDFRWEGQLEKGKVVEIKGVYGESVGAYTINGDVRISTAEQARAETINGDITVSMGSSDWNDTLVFRTINGSITLELPPTANANLQVNTINGRISSELPLIAHGAFKDNRLEGVIGNGGGRLKLSTINGSVKLRRK